MILKLKQKGLGKSTSFAPFPTLLMKSGTSRQRGLSENSKEGLVIPLNIFRSVPIEIAVEFEYSAVMMISDDRDRFIHDRGNL